MTREEAIEILQKYLFDDEECVAQDMKDYNEALKMAIEALSADSVHKPDYSYEAGMVRRLKEAQSVDAVQGGRYENAMQKLREMPKYLNNVKAKQIKKISADRPSNVLQEKNPTPIKDYMTGKSRLADRPSGEWVNEWKDIDGGRMYGACCSVCHTIGHSGYNYCPNCGARMKGDDTE